jgi:hypothetical protein
VRRGLSAVLIFSFLRFAIGLEIGIEHRPLLAAFPARWPTKVATIAPVNKIARIAWATLAKGDRYREPVALAA